MATNRERGAGGYGISGRATKKRALFCAFPQFYKIICCLLQSPGATTTHTTIFRQEPFSSITKVVFLVSPNKMFKRSNYGSICCFLSSFFFVLEGETDEFCTFLEACARKMFFLTGACNKFYYRTCPMGVQTPYFCEN